MEYNHWAPLQKTGLDAAQTDPKKVIQNSHEAAGITGN